MDEMITEYRSEHGVSIVRVRQDLYYYGDGERINAFGKSANQFLRFNPYMDYVADKNEQPGPIIKKWIQEHVEDGET